MYVMPISSGFIDPLKPLFEKAAKTAGDEFGGLISAPAKPAESFAEKLKNSIAEIKGMEDKAAQDSYELAMGNTDNLEEIMINSAKLQTTIDLATTVTGRVVSTYKEIMAMQI